MAEPNADIAAQKSAMRREIRARLDALDGLQIESRSRALADRLFATSWWTSGQWIFVFIPMFGEVDTRFIVAEAYREAKQVAIPRMEGEELAFYAYDGDTENLIPNQFGILEPDPSWKLVNPAAPTGKRLLVLAPGLAFDRQGRRLGKGKGYYDRFLHGMRVAHPAGRDSWAVGLALTEQFVDKVPVSVHDERLEGIVTDREVIDSGSLGRQG